MLKIVVFVVAVLGALFVAPMAASAVPYTPGAQVVANDYSLSPCQSIDIHADAGYFVPGEAVQVSISGTDDASTTWSNAVVGASTSGTSTSTGAFDISTKVSRNASGSYNITLTSPSASGSVVLAVAAANPSNPSDPADPSDPTNSGSGSNLSSSGSSASGVLSTAGLATTGVSISGAIVWGAAGLVALGIALMIVRGMVRREGRTGA
jgi:hypothetical protein